MAKYILQNKENISNFMLELNKMKSLCVCLLCKDCFLEPITLPCSHTFCKRCLNTYERCPSCNVCIEEREDDTFYSILSAFVQDTVSNIKSTMVKDGNGASLMKTDNNNMEVDVFAQVKKFNTRQRSKKTKSKTKSFTGDNNIDLENYPSTSKDNVMNRNIKVQNSRKRKIISVKTQKKKRSPIPLEVHYNIPVAIKNQNINQSPKTNEYESDLTEPARKKLKSVAINTTDEKLKKGRPSLTDDIKSPISTKMVKSIRPKKIMNKSINADVGPVENPTTEQHNEFIGFDTVVDADIVTAERKQTVSDVIKPDNIVKKDIKITERLDVPDEKSANTPQNTNKTDTANKSNVNNESSTNKRMLRSSLNEVKDIDVELPNTPYSSGTIKSVSDSIGNDVNLTNQKCGNAEELIEQFLQNFDDVLQYDASNLSLGVMESTYPKRAPCIEKIQKYFNRLLPKVDLMRLCLKKTFRHDCLYFEEMQMDAKTQTESINCSVDVGSQTEPPYSYSIHTQTVDIMCTNVGVQTKTLKSRDSSAQTKDVASHVQLPIKKNNMSTQTDNSGTCDVHIQTESLPVQIDITKINRLTKSSEMDENSVNCVQEKTYNETESCLEFTLEPSLHRRNVSYSHCKENNNNRKELLDNDKDQLMISFETEECDNEFSEEVHNTNVEEENDIVSDGEERIDYSPDVIENTEDIDKSPLQEFRKVPDIKILQDIKLPNAKMFDLNEYNEINSDDIDVIPATPTEDCKKNLSDKNEETYDSIVTHPVKFVDNAEPEERQVEDQESDDVGDVEDDANDNHSEGTDQENMKRLSNVKPIVTCSRMNSKQLNSVMDLHNMNLITFVNKILPNVTHLIIFTCDDERERSVDAAHRCMDGLGNQIVDQTAKYVMGVAMGMWVLSYKWIEKCLKRKYLVDEEPYEVIDLSGVAGPKCSRLSDKRDLLKNFIIHTVPPYETMKKSDLEHIIRALGGVVAQSPDNFLLDDNVDKIPLILCDINSGSQIEKFDNYFEKYNVISVDVEWLSRSVGRFELVKLNSYTLNRPNVENVIYPSWLFDINHS